MRIGSHRATPRFAGSDPSLRFLALPQGLRKPRPGEAPLPVHGRRGHAERARRRYETRNARLLREQQDREAELDRQRETAKRAGPEAIAEILKRKRQDREED